MERRIDKTSITQLINEVYVNMYLLERCYENLDDEDAKYMVQRMKLQKELFIKELCRVFQIDRHEHFQEFKKQILDSVREDLYNRTLNSVKSIFNLINHRAEYLLGIYYELLFDELNSEIAKMIIRNHIKEIRRDKGALKDIQEHVMSWEKDR